jgi:hypothetical protein
MKMKKEKTFSNKTFLSLLPHLAAGFLSTQGDPFLTTTSFFYLALCQIAKLNNYSGSLRKIGEWIHILSMLLLALKTTTLHPEIHVGLIITFHISIVLMLAFLIKNRIFTLNDLGYLVCIVIFFFLYRKSSPFHLPFILIFYDILFIGHHPDSRPDYFGAALICILHIFTAKTLYTFALPVSYLAARSLVLIFTSLKACLKDEKCRSSKE